MAQEGESGQALTAARAALTARDAELAAADRVLRAIVAEAHAVAAESVDRIAAIRADIDAAPAGRSVDGPAAAHALSRLLIAKQREITAVVNAARAEVDAKTVALQGIAEQYRSHFVD